jgi:hypothetical protein
MPAAQATSEIDLVAMMSKLESRVLQAVAELTSEVRCLRRDRQPASSEILEELCAAIYAACGCQPFTSSTVLGWVIEEPDKNTERLLNAIINATGPDPDPNTLARLMTRSCGTCGPWRLMLHKARSNQGKLFRIEKLHSSHLVTK